MAARRQSEWERDTILAYQGVRIYVKTMNEGRMPTLRSLIEPTRQQTPAEQMAAVDVIAAQFGWTRQRRAKKRGRRG